MVGGNSRTIASPLQGSQHSSTIALGYLENVAAIEVSHRALSGGFAWGHWPISALALSSDSDGRCCGLAKSRFALKLFCTSDKVVGDIVDSWLAISGALSD